MNASAAVRPFDPADYRGRNALLFLFAPSIKSPVYQSQMDLLEGAGEALQAHEIVVVQVLLQGQSHVDGRRLDTATAGRLRAQYDVAPDAFCLVLVGRDGAVLRKDDAPLKAEALFDGLA